MTRPPYVLQTAEFKRLQGLVWWTVPVDLPEDEQEAVEYAARWTFPSGGACRLLDANGTLVGWKGFTRAPKPKPLWWLTGLGGSPSRTDRPDPSGPPE